MKRTSWITWLGAMASIGALGAGQTGCTNVDCGTGTIDKDGKCIPSDNTFGNAACGPGTHLGTDGKCTPDSTVMCDPSSTTAETDPITHITTCVGTGTMGCGSPISCPNASSGHQTICGQLLDLETSQPIAATGATGTPCDPNNPTADGPCALVMQAYNALQFAADPATATPLANDEIVIDDCGRFRIKNIPTSGLQFIGIGVDDSTKSPAMDLHRLTGGALPAVAGQTTKGFVEYAITKATDMKWTQQASLGASTFVDIGVYIGIFLENRTPVAGVTVTRGGSPSPGDDYYFSDASPATRTTIAPSQNVTGADGTALLINGGGLILYSGQGAEPANCEWNPNLQGAEIAKVAFVEPQQAVLKSDGTTICP